MLTGISGASDGMKKSQMWHGGKVFQGTVPSVQSSRLLSELKLPVATEAGAFGGALGSASRGIFAWRVYLKHRKGKGYRANVERVFPLDDMSLCNSDKLGWSIGRPQHTVMSPCGHKIFFCATCIPEKNTS